MLSHVVNFSSPKSATKDECSRLSAPSDRTDTAAISKRHTSNNHEIEEYVQPLYSRGWGLSPILPNGNGIAVLRKRFEFASAEALEEFLAGLSQYEEKKQVRFFSFCSGPLYQTRIYDLFLFSFLYFRPSPIFQIPNRFSTTQREMSLRINMPSLSARGRTSLEEGQIRT